MPFKSPKKVMQEKIEAWLSSRVNMVLQASYGVYQNASSYGEMDFPQYAEKVKEWIKGKAENERSGA